MCHWESGDVIYLPKHLDACLLLQLSCVPINPSSDITLNFASISVQRNEFPLGVSLYNSNGTVSTLSFPRANHVKCASLQCKLQATMSGDFSRGRCDEGRRLTWYGKLATKDKQVLGSESK